MQPTAQEEANQSGLNTVAARTVLYVDDHPINVLLMQAMFDKRPELHLVVATTAEAGLLAAIEAKPDLLLLDLHLPDGHGVDLLRRMREVDHLRTVPAVAVTADTVCDLTGQGFHEIWHKPMDMRATLLRLDWLLMLAANERSQAAASNADATAPADIPIGAGRTPAARNRRPAPDPIPFPTAEPLAESQRAVEATQVHLAQVLRG